MAIAAKRPSGGTVLLAAAAGGALGRLAFGALKRRPEPVSAAFRVEPKAWDRTNHRGEPVTLLEGPAYAAAATAAVALAPGLPPRLRTAAVLASAGAGAFGVYDDLYGNGDRRGLRGHLTALAKGEVTTGGVKLLGIGLVGMAAGALARPPGSDSLTDRLLAGAVVAAGANMINLFDLRPGRAIKAATLAAAPALLLGDLGSAANVVRAAALGSAAAVLPEDLGERAMLGDAGANALGALLGVAAVSVAGRPGLLWRAAGLLALTAASEKVSFTKVIAGCPPLRALDGFGRRV
jgi:UDP-GlcNAc:undecaprenyl-phosphate/decaprenyl-phosphate GlcNAc-1-phosphate transferase